MNIIKGISQVACAIACAVLLAGASPANADGVTWTYEKIDKTTGTLSSSLDGGLTTDWKWNVTWAKPTVKFTELIQKGSSVIDFTGISTTFGTNVGTLKGVTTAGCLLPGVTSVILPDTLTKIDTCVFYQSGVQELTITAAGNLTLSDCIAQDSSIKKLTVTANKVILETQTFRGMTSLTDIYWNTSAPDAVERSNDEKGPFYQLTAKQVTNHVGADFVESWKTVPGLIGTFDEKVTEATDDALWAGLTRTDGGTISTYAQYLVCGEGSPTEPVDPPDDPTGDVTWTYDKTAKVLRYLRNGETDWEWGITQKASSGVQYVQFTSLVTQGKSLEIDFTKISDAFGVTIGRLLGTTGVDPLPGVKSVILPDTLPTIGKHLFDAHNATELTITAANSLIFESVIAEGSAIEKLTVSAQSVELVTQTFDGMSSLSDIYWNTPAPTGPSMPGAKGPFYNLGAKKITNHVVNEGFVSSWSTASGLIGTFDETVTEPTDDVLWAGYTCTAASTPEDTLAKSAQYIVCGVKAPKKSGLLIIFSQK